MSYDICNRRKALASRLVVFLAFVPLEQIESAFEAFSVHIHIAGTYPELMAIVNYFSKLILANGLAQLT